MTDNRDKRPNPDKPEIDRPLRDEERRDDPPHARRRDEDDQSDEDVPGRAPGRGQTEK